MFRENHIRVIRDIFTLRGCGGQLFIGSSIKRFCFTLEDVPRGENIKIPKDTAIPAGVYNWKVTHSNRFKRPMILIYTDPIEYSLKAGGVKFTGIRIHGGNEAADTEGCILAGYERVDVDHIYHSAEKELNIWAANVGGEGTIEIINEGV